jgi:hypothetical protein
MRPFEKNTLAFCTHGFLTFYTHMSAHERIVKTLMQSLGTRSECVRVHQENPDRLRSS